MTFVLTALLCLAAGGAAHAADYYVSPTGNDSNPGTIAAPWKTALRAFNTTQLQPGDTVHFRQGDYPLTDPDNFLYPKKSGRAGAPITFKSYNGEKANLVWAAMRPPSGGRSRMLYIGVSHIVIDGLNLRQTEESRRLSIIGNVTFTPKGQNSATSINAIGVWGDNVTVRNCSLDNFSGPGIGVNGSNFLVEYCRVTGTGSHGFYIRGANGTYRYNLLDGSRGYWNQQGMQIQYASARGNKIYGNIGINGQSTAFVVSGRTSNNEIFNNVFINGGSKSGNTGGSGGPVGFWCEDGPMGPGNKIYNNTFIGKSGPTKVLIGDPLTPKCGGIRPATRVEIRDNIFHTSPAVRVGLYTPNVRNNIFYNVTGAIPPGNLSVNPMLVNPNGTTAADAMLQAGSPAIDKASTGAPALDYQAGTRPVGAAADIGAFEHGAPPGPLGGPVGSSDTGGTTTTPPLDCPPVGIEAAGNPFAPTAPGISTPPVMTGATTTPMGTGKNYYMSPSGNDSNPGTEAAPWKTLDRLQTAVNSQLRPGDTVWFRGGDYTIMNANKHWYSWRADGTSSAPVIYRNYQNEKPVIIYDRIDSNNEVDPASVNMLFVSGDHVIIDGLNFRQSERSRSMSTRTVSGATTYINRTARKSALAVYGSNVTIRNCSIENFSGLGMATPGNNILVEHCTLDTANHNFYLQGANGTFRYNYIAGSRQIKSGRTMQIQYDGTDNNKVYGNLFINGAADAIVFSGRIAGNEVFNNVIVNGGTVGYAVGFWCEDGPIGAGNKFYNNTVIGRSLHGLIAPGSCRSKDTGLIGRNVDIYNNIFHPSVPVRVGLSTPKIRNNIFYNITGSVPPGNTLVNPNLANPAGTTAADAMIQAGSPAIDKAPTGAPALDYQGGTRPVGAAADIGAYEFGAPPGPLGGPVGGGGGSTGGGSVPPGCPPPFVPDAIVPCIPPDP